VQPVRRGDADDVDVRRGHELAPVGVGATDAEAGDRVVAGRGLVVGDGDELDVALQPGWWWWSLL